LTDYPVVQRKRRPSTRSELANDTIKHKTFPAGEAPHFGYSRDEATTYFIGCGWNSMATWEK
jgi:hypothetical protein